MDSSGQHIFNGEGLSTKQCFDFLLSLPKERIYAAFGLNYDVNMMLVDFGKARLRELWTDGECLWFDYHVQWIPGKWFRVKHIPTKRAIKVNEVFGFYQSSFVKALTKWKIPTQDLDELEDMKASRSIFTDEMRERVIKYCHTETLLLNTLLEALRDALESIGIKNTSWNGAGSIAAAIMKQENVKAHLVHQNELPKEIQYATLRAYFGGRTELYQQGHHSLIYQYDLVSAYPWAATYLPSLRDGTWTHQTVYDPRSEHAIWSVVWNVDGRVTPFPYRYKGTRICYPTNGRGWYHACEVTAAIEVFGKGIHVQEGWTFAPRDPTVQPFAFIPRLAAEKVRYKREGHAGEKVLKLGINSLYGKLAQGKGFNDTLPPFQSYFWAGEITARTRATMLRLAAKDPTAVVMIATDGIFLSRPLDVQTGDTLGALELTELTDMFTAQPGVYRAVHDGEELRKSRGFFAREIDFPSLMDAYSVRGAYAVGRYDSTRFVGIGVALMARTLDEWRTWQTRERRLSLYPSSKRVLDPDTDPVIHLPPQLAEPVLPSAPYRPKMKGYLEDEEDYTQAKEQPLRG